MKNMMARLDKLESDIRRTRSARLDPLTNHVLERMTMPELVELEGLLRDAGDPYIVSDLPDEPRTRAMELIDAASQRTQPAPWPASSAPGYDVMASIHESYEASQARAVQSANPAMASVSGHSD